MAGNIFSANYLLVSTVVGLQGLLVMGRYGFKVILIYPFSDKNNQDPLDGMEEILNLVTAEPEDPWIIGDRHNRVGACV